VIDLTAEEMIAKILQSLERTGERLSPSRSKNSAARKKSKSPGSRTKKRAAPAREAKRR